jgi:hypothetical protein
MPDKGMPDAGLVRLYQDYHITKKNEPLRHLENLRKPLRKILIPLLKLTAELYHIDEPE